MIMRLDSFIWDLQRLVALENASNPLPLVQHIMRDRREIKEKHTEEVPHMLQLEVDTDPEQRMIKYSRSCEKEQEAPEDWLARFYRREYVD